MRTTLTCVCTKNTRNVPGRGREHEKNGFPSGNVIASFAPWLPRRRVPRRVFGCVRRPPIRGVVENDIVIDTITGVCRGFARQCPRLATQRPFKSLEKRLERTAPWKRPHLITSSFVREFDMTRIWATGILAPRNITSHNTIKCIIIISARSIVFLSFGD